MERKPVDNAQLAREYAVYKYLRSLDNDDIDGIIQAWNQAVFDPILDRMLIEAHQVYFQEEGIMQHHPFTQTPPRAEAGHLSSMPARPQMSQPKRRRLSWWAQGLAAVLLAGVLIGGFVTLFVWHQAGNNNATAPSVHILTPARSACTAFQQYPAPVPGTLAAATTLSANNAWAVGYTVIPGGLFVQTLTEHWDGKSWKAVASPNGAGGNGALNAVAAVSPNDVWAVGSYGRVGAATDIAARTLIEHWDGSKWSIVPSPNHPNSVGAQSPSGNGILNAVAAISANDVWAVGQAVKPGGTTYLPLIEHWDGKQWSVVSGFPVPVSAILNGLVAVSAQDIWVAGSTGGGSQEKGLMAHWDGSHWKRFTSFPDVFRFTALSMAAQDDIWAIAGSLTSDTSLFEHWNGKKWSAVSLPQLAPSTTSLSVGIAGIAAASSSDVWAVGDMMVDGKQEQFLVLHWNGKIWQRVTIQVPQAQSGNLADAIAIGDTQTWILGHTIPDGPDEQPALIEGCSQPKK